MRVNLVREGADSIEAEEVQASRRPEDGQFVVAFRKMVKREVEEIMIHIMPQMMRPMVEDLVHKAVHEEIQSTKKRMLASGNWTNTNLETMSNGRSLFLMFLDEVSDDILTGKEIKGKEGTPIRVAIYDKDTGHVCDNSGPESSAKVQILFLESSANDNNKDNWIHEDFESRIIEESDKTKPHFAQICYVYLEKGIGELRNAKLAHYSNWTKSCKCRLGARVVENLSGIKVQEACTNPFVVSDSRGKLYAKHFPPCLYDEVWRLVNIGRDGRRHKRLRNNSVSTIQDFLFLLSVDPQRLKDIVDAADTAWKAIEKHAQTCKIDDTRICLYKDNSSEGNTSVVFDVIGKLKGVIQDSLYVLENHLSEAEKERARKLLRSAFEHRDHITFFGDETTLVRRYPYRTNNGAEVNASSQKCFRGIDFGISESGDLSDTTDLSISLSIGPPVNVNNETTMQ